MPTKVITAKTANRSSSTAANRECPPPTPVRWPWAPRRAAPDRQLRNVARISANTTAVPSPRPLRNSGRKRALSSSLTSAMPVITRPPPRASTTFAQGRSLFSRVLRKRVGGQRPCVADRARRTDRSRHRADARRNPSQVSGSAAAIRWSRSMNGSNDPRHESRLPSPLVRGLRARRPSGGMAARTSAARDACCVERDGNSADGACKRQRSAIARRAAIDQRRVIVEQAIEIGARSAGSRSRPTAARKASVTSSRKRAPSVTERSRSSVGLTRSMVAP